MVTLPELFNAPRIQGRNQGIDILRGIFALWVFLAHLFPWALARGQDDAVLMALNTAFRHLATLFQGTGALHPAVLGFIVLSGYCIHRNGLRVAADPVPPYATKRLFRIVPIFILASMAGYLIITGRSPEDFVFRMTGGVAPDLPALWLKLSGLSVFHPLTYPAIFQGNAPLVTVMVEIWLYILYIPLLALSRRIPIMAFFAGLLALLCIAAWVSPQGWFQNASLYKFLLYWWIGVAFVSFAKNRLFIKTILACLIIFGASRYAGSTHPIFIEVFHIGLALMVGWMVRALEIVELKTLILRPLSTIGQAGYSLYAFHTPIALLLLATGMPWYLVFAITIIASIVIFKLLEDPVSRMGARLAKRQYSRTVET